MKPTTILTALRLQGWTQRQIAEELGVTEQSVSRWAQGHLPITEDRRAQLEALQERNET